MCAIRYSSVTSQSAGVAAQRADRAAGPHDIRRGPDHAAAQAPQLRRSSQRAPARRASRPGTSCIGKARSRSSIRSFSAASMRTVRSRPCAKSSTSSADISLLNRMLFYDWHYTLADNDLRKVDAMCELAGVDVSYPMLDRRVVDLSLRVPPAVRRSPATSCARSTSDAMADFLPGEILTKTEARLRPALRRLAQNAREAA